MDAVQAFDELLSRGPGPAGREVWPGRVVRKDPSGDTDVWPLWTAALASMSGQLEDAATPEELNAAIEHAWCLVRCEVFTLLDIKRECQEICRQINKRRERVISHRDPAFFETGKGEES